MTARPGLPQYIYDGQVLVAVIEPVDGGWRLIVRGREIGIFKRREEAIAVIDEDAGKQ
jgi:hypothetical protein